MSRSYYMTPEERVRKKQRDKRILYAVFIIGTAVVSSGVTILMNGM